MRSRQPERLYGPRSQPLQRLQGSEGASGHRRQLQRRHNFQRPSDAPPSARPFHQDGCSRHRPPMPGLSSLSAKVKHRRVSSQRSYPAEEQDWNNLRFPGRNRPTKLASPLLPFSALDRRRIRRLLCRIGQRGPKLAYVYFEEEPGRRSAAKLLTKDVVRRIAVNIAKLPELLG